MNTKKLSSEKEELDILAVGKLINRVKTIAKDYRELTGRPLGITGEVAEYEAARLLNLELTNVRQAGYDAIRSDGTKIQIKGRVIFETSKPGQRIGRICLDHEWDSVFLTFPTGWRYRRGYRELRKASLDRIRMAICKCNPT